MVITRQQYNRNSKKNTLIRNSFQVQCTSYKLGTNSSQVKQGSLLNEARASLAAELKINSVQNNQLSLSDNEASVTSDLIRIETPDSKNPKKQMSISTDGYSIREDSISLNSQCNQDSNSNGMVAKIDVGTDPIDSLPNYIPPASHETHRQTAKRIVEFINSLLISSIDPNTSQIGQLVAAEVGTLYELFILQEEQLIRMDSELKATKTSYASKLRENFNFSSSADLGASSKLNGNVSNSVSSTEITVILEPKNGSINQQHFEDCINKALDPRELKLNLNSYRVTKKGNLLLTSKRKRDIDVIKEKIQTDQALSEIVNVREPQKRDPKVILYNIPSEIEGEELSEFIEDQNDIDLKDAKVCFHIKRGEFNHWILQVKPELFQKLREYKALYVGRSRIKWAEFVSVLQCYQCGRFGHMRKDCMYPDSCSNCGVKDTPSHECKTRRCVNCHYSNQNFGTNYFTFHSCWDRNCSAKQYEIQMIKQKINYG